MDQRDHAILTGLRAGRTQASLAKELSISPPAVSARIRKNEELRRARRHSPTAVLALKNYRRQLYLVELEARAVARRISAALRSVDEELEVAAIEALIES